jgi:hypothetical protein
MPRGKASQLGLSARKARLVALTAITFIVGNLETGFEGRSQPREAWQEHVMVAYLRTR